MNVKGVFVLSPWAFRLAEGDVVRHGVQTPLQTPPRLVPTHQGSQPGHCLHRGNSNDDRNTDACCRQGIKTFPPVLFQSWNQRRYMSSSSESHHSSADASLLLSRPPLNCVVLSDWFECNVSSNCTGRLVKCLPDCSADWKRLKGKWLKKTDDWKMTFYF